MNPFLLTTKRYILELSRSLEQLYYRILLNILNIAKPNS